MMQSIAIQAYFSQMRHFFTRQGFDGSMKVVYGADAEGPQRLLDTDMANKEMDRKQGSNKDNIRQAPYTYLFWTRGSLQNIVRRSINLRDNPDPTDPKHRFKKTVAASFGMSCVLVSNKANLIEDFSEAFSAEYQNLHNIPINVKWGYDDHDGFNTANMSATVIQELGTEELVSFRIGNLFSYSWNLTIYLQLVSEFADWKTTPIKSVVVDLYNKNGVPLASMDLDKSIKNNGGDEAIREVGLELEKGESYTLSLEKPSDVNVPLFTLIARDNQDDVTLTDGTNDLQAADPADPSGILFYIRSVNADGVTTDIVAVYGDVPLEKSYTFAVPADSVEILVGGTLDPYSNVNFTVSPASPTVKGLWKTYTATDGTTYLVPKIPFVEQTESLYDGLDVGN